MTDSEREAGAVLGDGGQMTPRAWLDFSELPNCPDEIGARLVHIVIGPRLRTRGGWIIVCYVGDYVTARRADDGEPFATELDAIAMMPTAYREVQAALVEHGIRLEDQRLEIQA